MAIRTRHLTWLCGLVFLGAAQIGLPMQGPQLTRSYNSLFDPSQQALLYVESDAMRLSLERSQECDTCPGGRRTLVFEVRAKDTDEARTFVIENDTAQVDEIHLFEDRLAIVIGRYLSRVSVVNLIDLQRGDVIDSFWALRPAVSPDRRFVVYVKVFPRSSPSASYQYLVYDVLRTPEAQRGGRANLSDHTNVGTAVYPSDTRNEPRSNLGIPASAAHTMRSDGFFWLSEERFAFADEWQERLEIIGVDLSMDLSSPVIYREALPVHEIVDLDECPRFRDLPVRPVYVDRIEQVEQEESLLYVGLTSISPQCLLERAYNVSFSGFLP